MDTPTCAVALKEWALTCRSLQDGLQIVLLRKGGLLDADGTFDMEHNAFWLQPTYLHQSRHLVKREFLGLLDEVEAAQLKGENRNFLQLQLLARVEQTFVLPAEDADLLSRVRHIWSTDYIDLRYSFRPEYPLLCAALRVYARAEPHVVPMRPEYGGCRSWLELVEPLDCSALHPVVSDAEFALQFEAVAAIFDSRTAATAQEAGRIG